MSYALTMRCYLRVAVIPLNVGCLMKGDTQSLCSQMRKLSMFWHERIRMIYLSIWLSICLSIDTFFVCWITSLFVSVSAFLWLFNNSISGKSNNPIVLCFWFVFCVFCFVLFWFSQSQIILNEAHYSQGPDPWVLESLHTCEGTKLHVMKQTKGDCLSTCFSFCVPNNVALASILWQR